MATTHIRDAFNQEAGDKAVCSKAFIDYVFREGIQRQVITLNVVYANGTQVTLQTPVHGMQEDPNEMARELARGLQVPAEPPRELSVVRQPAPEPDAPPVPAPEPAPKPTAAPGAESAAAAVFVPVATQVGKGDRSPGRDLPNPFISG